MRKMRGKTKKEMKGASFEALMKESRKVFRKIGFESRKKRFGKFGWFESEEVRGKSEYLREGKRCVERRWTFEREYGSC